MTALGQAQLDWNDVRFFLAVAREETLGRAAAALEVDQTTVGRRLASLERRFEVALFSRSSRGLKLTSAGRRVFQAAAQMEQAAVELTAAAVEGAQDLAGTVRIATTESLAEAFLIPAVRQLRSKHPKLRVTLATAWTRVDLRRGEADLAVRLARPSDPRLACRKLGDFRLRLFASREYLARQGTPHSLEGHQLIAYEEALQTNGLHPFNQLPSRANEVALLSNSHRVLLTAALAGLGIVQLPSYVGDRHKDLVALFPDHQPKYSVWLVVPQANRRLAAVRAAIQAINAEFEKSR